MKPVSIGFIGIGNVGSNLVNNLLKSNNNVFVYDKNNFFAGIYDQDYGICKPILNVVYQRSYYKIFNINSVLLLYSQIFLIILL